MEQVGFEEDLAVGDRDHVGRDVRRQVARLGLDDRQRGERTAAELGLQLRGALEQTRVQVEHIAGVGLPARRPAQQQRDLAIRLRVLRQVVVDQQRVASAVAEELAHRARRVRADVEQRRRIGRRGGDHDRVPHRVGFFERAHHLRDRRLLLADRVVDADDTGVLLVENRIDRNRGLPRLTVADDQLPLTPADRHHRVDRLQAGLQRLLDRLPIHHAGRQPLDRRERLGRDRSFAVDWLTERVHDAAEQLVAHRYRDDAARALDQVPFLDLLELAQEHRADAFFLEVQRDAEHAVRKLEHLAGHRILHTVHPRDAVAD